MMIATTPLITPLAVKIGARRAVVLGFGVAAIGFAVLAFVNSSWTYAAFVAPLIAIAVGLGLANGPASSASTAAVSPDEVGQASGISNMARYIGGSLAVAAAAAVSTAVTINHREAGAAPDEAPCRRPLARVAAAGAHGRRRRRARRADATSPRSDTARGRPGRGGDHPYHPSRAGERLVSSWHADRERSSRS
jgi:Major Facilitator Superfamily